MVQFKSHGQLNVLAVLVFASAIHDKSSGDCLDFPSRYTDDVASEMKDSGNYAALWEIIPEVAGPLSDALTALGRF